MGSGAGRDEGRARTKPITSALSPRIGLGRKPLGNVGWFRSIFKGVGGADGRQNGSPRFTEEKQTERAESVGLACMGQRRGLTSTHARLHCELGRAEPDSPCSSLPSVPHDSLLTSPSSGLGEFRVPPFSFLLSHSVLWALGSEGSFTLPVAQHPPSTLDSASRWASGWQPPGPNFGFSGVASVLIKLHFC